MNTNYYLQFKIGTNNVRHTIKGFLTKEKMDYYIDLNNQYQLPIVECTCRSCPFIKYIFLEDWLKEHYLTCENCGSIKTISYWLQKENKSMGRYGIINFPPKILYRPFQNNYVNITSTDYQIDENNVEYLPENILNDNKTAWISETIDSMHELIWEGDKYYNLASFYMQPYLYNYPSHQGCPRNYILMGDNNDDDWKVILEVKDDPPEGNIIHTLDIPVNFLRYKLTEMYSEKVLLFPVFETAKYDRVLINKYVDYEGNPEDYFSNDNTIWLLDFDDFNTGEIVLDLNKIGIIKKIKIYNIIPNKQYFNECLVTVPNQLDIWGSNDNIDYYPIMTIFNMDLSEVFEREITSYAEYEYIKLNNFKSNLPDHETKIVNYEEKLPILDPGISNFYCNVPDSISYKNTNGEYTYINLNELEELENISNLDDVVLEIENSEEFEFNIKTSFPKKLSRIIINSNNESILNINTNKSYKITNINVLGSNNETEWVIINNKINNYTNSNEILLNKNAYKYYKIQIRGTKINKIIESKHIESIISTNDNDTNSNIYDMFLNSNLLWRPANIQQFSITGKTTCSITISLTSNIKIVGCILNVLNPNSNFKYNIYGSTNGVKWTKLNNQPLNSTHSTSLINPQNLISNQAYKHYMLWDFERNNNNISNLLELSNIFLFTTEQEYGPLSLKLPQLYEAKQRLEEVPRYMGISNIELLTAVFPYDENAIANGEFKETYGSLSIGKLALTEQYIEQEKPVLFIDNETENDDYYKCIFHSHYHGP
jgi:hypothetical protein